MKNYLERRSHQTTIKRRSLQTRLTSNRASKIEPFTTMKYRTEIDIMPHAELLDPQGKTVLKNMGNVDIEGVQDVRIGKHVTMMVEAADEESAKAVVQKRCEKLLANLIMEKFSFEIFPVEEEVAA